MIKLKQKDTVKRILTYIKPYRFFMCMSILLAIISVALTLYAPILTGNAIDLMLGKGKVDFGALFSILVKYLIIVIGTAAAQWLMNICNNSITYKVVKNIRTDAFLHLTKLPIKYVDGNSNGDIISRIISDVDQFTDGLLIGFTQLFTSFMTIIGTLIFMISINIKITLVVVVITPLSLFVASFIAKHTYHMFHAQAEAKGALTGHIEEMIGKQKVVTAFTYEERSIDRFEKLNKTLHDDSLSATFFSSLTNPSTRFVNSLVYAAVGVYGAICAIGGHISIGQLSCFLSYANQYTKPFNEISSVAAELQNAIACAARVFELMDEPEEIPDREDAYRLTDAAGTVEFNNVCFSYVPPKPFITDFNLKVEPGQRIAIVGPTGCGKSTLINLLMRFYDINSGNIKIDGHDTAKMTRNSLRTNVGMVLQDTWLKAGTIAENIAYGKPDATAEQIEKAAKLAHAHSFIKRMPSGYETVISEDGGNLSQGQKQLLCIARLMLDLPPMLILDEATSSIDTRTELKIQHAFAQMMQGRTSFIVAHRLSTIKEADCILVMKDGNIIEQGTHNELLEKHGFYYELYNSQYSQSNA